MTQNLRSNDACIHSISSVSCLCGGSIETNTPSILFGRAGEAPEHRSLKTMNDIQFEFCKSSDPRYQEIRNRHYVPNRGSHGQQIHFLIFYKREIIGIISGGSSVYAVKSRDMFFQIPKDQEIKQKYYLSAIINNTVFRLEYHEKNLATMILSRWRRIIADLWCRLYSVPVIGFETFVIESDSRKGALYKADNWTYVGTTSGNTKFHATGGLTKSFQRVDTDKKLIFCKKVKFGKPKIPYISSWKAKTTEEKKRAKQLGVLRHELTGKIFE